MEQKFENFSTNGTKPTMLWNRELRRKADNTGDRRDDEFRLAIPSGSLYEPTTQALRAAGYDLDIPDRCLIPICRNVPELKLALYRASEIPALVDSGIADSGITGTDMIFEEASERRYNRRAPLETDDVAKFQYAKKSGESRWILAVRSDSPYSNVEDLSQGLIRSEIPYATQRILRNKLYAIVVPTLAEALDKTRGGLQTVILPSAGASEAKCKWEADATVTVTESGGSVPPNGIREISELFRNEVCLMLNRNTRMRGQGQMAKDIAIRLLDNAGLKGYLAEEFDRDSNKWC